MENQENIENPENQAPEMQLDEKKMKRYLRDLKFEQNMSMALLAGAGTALISAIIWAMITVLTGYQIGIIAIGVGMFVGYAVRHFGKGIDDTYGLVGGGFAVLGCVLGNYFSIVSMASNEFNIPFTEALSTIGIGTAINIMAQTFSPVDILFYGFAAYEGYKFSFRNITEEEIIKAGLIQKQDHTME